MTTKETLVYMIKRKGDCTGLPCGISCSMWSCCMESRPVGEKWADWLYTRCLTRYINDYGKDELVGELI